MHLRGRVVRRQLWRVQDVTKELACPCVGLPVEIEDSDALRRAYELVDVGGPAVDKAMTLSETPWRRDVE